jgi:signal transduction histidine kinase
MITRSDTGLRWLDRAAPDLDKAKADFIHISADGHRAAAVIESIRAHFRKDAPVKEIASVHNLIGEAIALLRDNLESHQISVKIERGGQLLQVRGDRIQLQQVLLNLITNAIEAMATTDAPRVLAVGSSNCDDGAVMISIADTGTGISAEDAQRVFNPLFSTKPGGMGMGLSICRSIIEAHDGMLSVVPNAPRGSIFRVVLRAEAVTRVA